MTTLALLLGSMLSASGLIGSRHPALALVGPV